MHCWHCERPAHSQCKFCGRAVCKDHFKTMPHIVAVYTDAQQTVQALVTPEAVHCGVCRPLGAPVPLELKAKA